MGFKYVSENISVQLPVVIGRITTFEIFIWHTKIKTFRYFSPMSQMNMLNQIPIEFRPREYSQEIS